MSLLPLSQQVNCSLHQYNVGCVAKAYLISNVLILYVPAKCAVVKLFLHVSVSIVVNTMHFLFYAL